MAHTSLRHCTRVSVQPPLLIVDWILVIRNYPLLYVMGFLCLRLIDFKMILGLFDPAVFHV